MEIILVTVQLAIKYTTRTKFYEIKNILLGLDALKSIW